MSDELWRQVDELLAFVDAPEPLPADELPTLVRLLDRLAAAAPSPDGDTAIETEQDPPSFIGDAARAQIARRFPDLGFYWTCPHANPDREPEQHTGDAVDDVLDIAGDLREARWYRERGVPGDGVRYLRQVRNHWLRHLRDLQSHLHWLLYEAE